MKKLLFALMFALPVMAVAQTTQEVNVSATVEGTLTLTKVSDLVFGNIADADEDAVVDAIDTGDNENVGSGATRAQINTNVATPITYTVPATATLESSTTADEIIVNLSYAIGQTSPSSYTTGSSTNASSTDDNTLYIGGTIPSTQMENKEGQSFQGTITVTANFL